ncbi:hypothetical protein PPERSA_05446 [Pseudocohnilembus persalinus]|uniref:Uncharacterized protein n=1 Tax=Pseudocohnilembus persalinus TaxID=266149 RepID=A0A0V0R828_PSEPJ|nr:hypothetical protein PPERSA_05446 [Pseudocohnilembus persalinus]|eukprot:KRX10626.1 hypothetical protein PPERSA_05446 [Pseudocohnilembus persalinus]
MTQTQKEGQYNTFMQYLHKQMVNQASTNIKYQRLLKNLDQPDQALALPDPSQQDIDLQKEFSQKTFNYNGNSSKIEWQQQYQQQNQEKNKQSPLLTKEDFLNLHYSMVNLQQDAGAPQDPQVQKLKQNIELLGGIDDCVGAMEQTLNDYEIKHLNEKYIHYYTYYNKQREEEERIRQQEEEQRQKQQQSQYNPFFTHPKEIYEKSNLNFEGSQPIFNKTSNDFGKTNYSQFQCHDQVQQFQHQQQKCHEKQNDQNKGNMLEEFKKKREQQLKKLENWKKNQGF